MGIIKKRDLVHLKNVYCLPWISRSNVIRQWKHKLSHHKYINNFHVNDILILDIIIKFIINKNGIDKSSL